MILVINLILISSTDLNKSILDIFYMDMLLFLIFIGFLIIGYIRWKSTYKGIENALNAHEKIDTYLPEGEKLEQLLMRKIINFKNEEKLEEIKVLKESLEEVNDYTTKWIHEIKIPISVCEFIADRIEDEGLYDISKELRQEVERINFLINQILNISRASSYSLYFIVEEINLGTLVKSIIKNNINSFLSKKVEVEIENLDFDIFTDSKWAYYIVEQVINI
ncbi:sensor histidine kinase [Garciella nitratireducens]|nr:sensor histidine kinase [Garciella nitratireducens]